MYSLTGIYLQHIRNNWALSCMPLTTAHIKFLIIDEISMLSYEALLMIDERLRQITSIDEPFGNMNILLIGDLLQLPPIKASPVYEQPARFIPAPNIWRRFSLCELQTNMRQKGDDEFIEILNALRIGELNDHHFAILRRHICKDSELTDKFAVDKALRIYPTNKQVNAHNEKVVELYKQRNVKMFTILAQDDLLEINNKKLNENFVLDDIVSNDINKTGGLPRKLTIFIGAKVMLRRNYNVKKGLVNGSIGTISEIIWPFNRRDQIHDKDLPNLKIDFENGSLEIIPPVSVEFDAKSGKGTVVRRMLPVVLCWASTVHKMQGSTVDCAVINLGSKIFAPGQAYVALSRVKSLEGLRIEEDANLEKLKDKKKFAICRL